MRNRNFLFKDTIYQPVPSAVTNTYPVVELIKVTKVYPPDVVALQNISLTVNQGEIVVLTGISGAGKTTLLKLLYRLEHPTRGLVEILGKDLSALNSIDLQLMRQKIGVVYQDFKLLPKLTVMQNIAMPMEITYQQSNVIQKRVMDLLDMLNLADKHQQLAGKLSKGEQQRVTLARAAANAPSLLLADEPTGNLDDHSTALIKILFQYLNEAGSTIIIVTHDKSFCRDTQYRQFNLNYGVLGV